MTERLRQDSQDSTDLCELHEVLVEVIGAYQVPKGVEIDQITDRNFTELAALMDQLSQLSDRKSALLSAFEQLLDVLTDDESDEILNNLEESIASYAQMVTVAQQSENSEEVLSIFHEAFITKVSEVLSGTELQIILPVTELFALAMENEFITENQLLEILQRVELWQPIVDQSEGGIAVGQESEEVVLKPDLDSLISEPAEEDPQLSFDIPFKKGLHLQIYEVLLAHQNDPLTAQEICAEISLRYSRSVDAGVVYKKISIVRGSLEKNNHTMRVATSKRSGQQYVRYSLRSALTSDEYETEQTSHNPFKKGPSWRIFEVLKENVGKSLTVNEIREISNEQYAVEEDVKNFQTKIAYVLNELEKSQHLMRILIHKDSSPRQYELVPLATRLELEETESSSDLIDHSPIIFPQEEVLPSADSPFNKGSLREAIFDVFHSMSPYAMKRAETYALVRNLYPKDVNFSQFPARVADVRTQLDGSKQECGWVLKTFSSPKKGMTTEALVESRGEQDQVFEQLLSEKYRSKSITRKVAELLYDFQRTSLSFREIIIEMKKRHPNLEEKIDETSVRSGIERIEDVCQGESVPFRLLKTRGEGRSRFRYQLVYPGSGDDDEGNGGIDDSPEEESLDKVALREGRRPQTTGDVDDIPPKPDLRRVGAYPQEWATPGGVVFSTVDPTEHSHASGGLVHEDKHSSPEKILDLGEFENILYKARQQIDQSLKAHDADQSDSSNGIGLIIQHNWVDFLRDVHQVVGGSSKANARNRATAIHIYETYISQELKDLAFSDNTFRARKSGAHAEFAVYTALSKISGKGEVRLSGRRDDNRGIDVAAVIDGKPLVIQVKSRGKSLPSDKGILVVECCQDQANALLRGMLSIAEIEGLIKFANDRKGQALVIICDPKADGYIGYNDVTAEPTDEMVAELRSQLNNFI